VRARDDAASRANRWLAARGLPKMRPVDGVDQLHAILSGKEGRPKGLVLSTKSALKRVRGKLYKLVTGVQPYSRHLSTAYPNCSMYCAPSPGFLTDGPDFVDFKCVDRPVLFRGDPAEASRAKWDSDCGEEGCLFNLDDDPSEAMDLKAATCASAADKDAARAEADLRRMLTGVRSTEFAPNRGNLSFVACDTAVTNRGVYGPFASIPEFGIDVEAWYSARAPPTEPDAARFADVLAAARIVKADDARLLTAVMRRVIPVSVQLCTPVTPLSQMDVCLDQPDCNADVCFGSGQGVGPKVAEEHLANIVDEVVASSRSWDEPPSTEAITLVEGVISRTLGAAGAGPGSPAAARQL